MKHTIRISVLTLLMLIAGIIPLVHGQTPQPAGRGRLAYTVQRGDGQHIVSILDLDTGVTMSVAAGDFVWNGSWSPDGRHLLLNIQQHGQGQIDVFDLATQTTQRLTTGRAHTYNPSWSPDGQSIIYHEDDLQRQSPRLMLMAADGTGADVLYRGTAFFHAWSPDSAQIIISVEGELLRFDVETKRATPLDFEGFVDQDILISDWSRDGRRVAFTHLKDGLRSIHIADIAGTNAQRAVADASDHHTLKWAADGTHFTFLSARDHPRGDVYLSTGGSAERLTFTHGEAGARLVALAYWTPTAERNTLDAPMRVAPLADAAPIRQLLAQAVNSEDPISVTRHVMTALIDGTLDQSPQLVCAEFRDSYLEWALAIHAEYAHPEMDGVQFTITAQSADTAQVALSGQVSVLHAGARVTREASLIPLAESPITRVHLVYRDGWAVCTLP